MNIQTELTRITNAKAAIKTAIEGKGVTVPDGTMLDGMAALIEAIQAWGGGADVKSGTFTPAKEPTYGYTVTHNLGKIPILVAVIVGEKFKGTSAGQRAVCLIACNQIGVDIYAGLFGSDIAIVDYGNITNTTETTFRIANTCMLKALTYKWIVVG